MKFTYTYTRLHVADYETCKDFYQNILGMKIAFEDENLTEIDTGTTKITLLRQEKLKDICGSAIASFSSKESDKIALRFRVSDLEQACEYLKDKGVEFLNEPCNFPNQGYKSTFIRDPEGNLIELEQITTTNVVVG